MSENKFNFQKLTPKQDADISIYDEAICFAFENDDVKNVAISGAYSSGKSSLVESYKTKYPKKSFIHLSLAHFRSPEQENIDVKEDIKESVLEGKILNQLIHQIQAEKIPQTNFRVKKDIDEKATARIAVCISVFISCILFLAFRDNIIAYTNDLTDNWIKSLLSILSSPYSSIPATFITLICGVAFVFSVVKAQMNRNIFRKISLQGNEIEIFEKQDESYFDKYLNEVLYLFENAEADVFVFEDMDRFNASKIFERLREVNTLVNIHRKKQQKDKYVPLRFFYLIRDDIFISKDRTKFFDYIVPVVPVVDSSNSYEQFIKHLKTGGLLKKFNQSFLQGLSLYIDDMRILKNIYNEFVVYFNRLNTTDLDCDKMLAIIAYKNIFPRDFSNLQLKQGFVYEVFAQKGIFIESEIKALRIKKEIQLKRIEDTKKDFISDETELRDVYEAKKKRLPGGECSISYFNQNSSSQEKAVLLDQEFETRKQMLQYRIDNNVSELEKELSYIEKNINLISSKMLKDIITRENIEEIFAVQFDNRVDKKDEFSEIRGSEYFNLLKYLIRNGFIDETYSDYMTYFYEDSISANDKIFLRRITDKRGAEYAYELKEPTKVIASSLLRQVDFEEEETLNFDLMQCLLTNSSEEKYDSYLKTLISQICQKEKFDFIVQYYSKDIPHNVFVIKVNEYWSDFFYTVLQNQKFSKEQVRKYTIETLYYSDDIFTKLIDNDECLKNYISDSDDYLQINEPNILRLIDRFKLLNVLFRKLDYDLSDKDLFESVYQANLYILNFTNIKLMLQKEYRIDNESDIVHKNYSLIQSDSSSPLAKYVADNLSEYLEVVLQSCDGKICDGIESVTYLLNCDNLEHTQKERYIGVLATLLNDISLISDLDLWVSLLVKGVIVFSEDNVFKYYHQFGLKDELVDYINASTKPLNFKVAKNAFGDEVANNFFDSVIISNGLNADKYKIILLNLGYHYNKFTFEGIEDGKVSVLIAEKIIRMSVENLSHLREHYKSHVNEFIKKNLEAYLELQTEETFDFDEALQVISLSFEVDKKITLIALTSEPISVIEKGYEDELCSYILSHNLFEDDLDSLYKNYTTYQGATQEKIFEIAVKNISDICSNDIIMDELLQFLLFESNRIDFSYKVNLFDNILSTLNEESCCMIFDKIGVDELKNIFTQGSGRRKYSANDENTQILNTLKRHGWIYAYNIDEHNELKYTIVKNKPKPKVEFLD